jgi:hypothetical protein
MRPWHSHDPIALEELDTLQDRVDVKYVIGIDAFAALTEELRATHRVLEIDGRREFTYRTTYFDTPDLRVFRDHQQRRRRRYKARSREYVDSGARMFEVKLKGARGRTVKHRMPYDRDGLSAAALAFLDDTMRREYGRAAEPGLRTALQVVYRRVTFAAPGERLTCDFDLRFGGGARMLGDRVIVESKSAHGRARADRVLRALGERPEDACSKYCLGVALTDPRAKRNGLRRLLRKHFLMAALAVPALAVPATAQAKLPVVKIQAPAAIGDGKKAKASLRMPGYRGRIGIERRGHSSQRFPKKSFSIELRDARGEDRKVGLLGLPADGDWVLYAPYNDRTLMRNVLAYEAARSIGRYAPRTRFVELHLNGRYHGIYVLTEKVELGDERVDGKALVEFTFPVQAPTQGASFRGPVRKRPVVWADPAREDMTRKRANAIAAPVRAAERALYGQGSWREYLDEAAAIDFVLLQELFKNQDAFLGSAFLALRGDGKLHFGPIWDFDLALGNTGRGASSTLEGWILEHRHWSGRLMADPRFARGMAERWLQLRAAGLQQTLHRAIDASLAELRGELQRNFTRWPVLHRPLWPSTVGRGSHAAEVRHLRTWIDRRIAWIDAKL